MLEITVTINCPDLVQAATLLGAALLSKVEQIPHDTDLNTLKPGTYVQDPAPAPAPTPEAQKPVTVTVPVSVSGSSHAVTVPVSAPAYTLPQIATAGAQLMSKDPSLQQPLLELLGSYGCKTVSELKPDQLGAFAADLRKMGAQI